MAKKPCVLDALRKFEVSQSIFYKWIDQLEARDGSALEGLHVPELRRENKKRIE